MRSANDALKSIRIGTITMQRVIQYQSYQRKCQKQQQHRRRCHRHQRKKKNSRRLWSAISPIRPAFIKGRRKFFRSWQKNRRISSVMHFKRCDVTNVKLNFLASQRLRNISKPITRRESILVPNATTCTCHPITAKGTDVPNSLRPR